MKLFQTPYTSIQNYVEKSSLHIHFHKIFISWLYFFVPGFVKNKNRKYTFSVFSGVFHLKLFSSSFSEDYCDVTLVIPIENTTDSFVVGLGPSIAIVEWDGLSNKTSKPKYVKLIDPSPGNRLNDGKADSTGRLWVGKYIIYQLKQAC